MYFLFPTAFAPSWDEDTAIGTTLLTLLASDGDAAEELTFTITTSAPTNMVLGAQSGQLILTAPLDHETAQVLQ